MQLGKIFFIAAMSSVAVALPHPDPVTIPQPERRQDAGIPYFSLTPSQAAAIEALGNERREYTTGPDPVAIPQPARRQDAGIPYFSLTPSQAAAIEALGNE